MRGRRLLLPGILLVALAATAAGDDLARGDAAWARRAEGQLDGRARAEPVGEAIAAYEAAIEAEPARLDGYWRLMRARWFLGEFALRDDAHRRAEYERARAVSGRALALVAARVGGRGTLDALDGEALRAKLPPDEVGNVARIYFWSAIAAGAWGRLAGLLQIVRAGIANQLHDDAERVIALDPGVDEGGALRLLSRLHAELPHVPLLSGWVDRGQALPLAERAYAAYPAHPGNAYVLALAILDAAPTRRAEALGLLETVAGLDPRPDEIVEDLAIRSDARARWATEREHR